MNGNRSPSVTSTGSQLWPSADERLGHRHHRLCPPTEGEDAGDARDGWAVARHPLGWLLETAPGIPSMACLRHYTATFTLLNVVGRREPGPMDGSPFAMNPVERHSSETAVGSCLMSVDVRAGSDTPTAVRRGRDRTHATPDPWTRGPVRPCRSASGGGWAAHTIRMVRVRDLPTTPTPAWRVACASR